MNKLFSIFLLLISFVSIAQDGDVEYNVKNNQVDRDAANLSVILNPFFTDVSNDNTVVGYNGELKFRLGTVLTLQGYYSGSITNTFYDQVKSENPLVYNGIPQNGNLAFRNFGGLFTFYMWTNKFETNGKLPLPSEVRSGEVQHYYVSVPMSAIQQFGLRAGYSAYQSQLAEKSLEFYGTNAETEVPGIGYIGDAIDNFAGGNYTSIKQGIISGGFCYSRVNHLTISLDSGKVQRHKKSQWEIYADGFYVNPEGGFEMDSIVVMTDVAETGSLYEATYDLKKYTEYTPWGFRVGFNYNRASLVGWTYGFEVGARPGTGDVLGRSYAMVKAGISLNWKVGKE